MAVIVRVTNGGRESHWCLFQVRFGPNVVIGELTGPLEPLGSVEERSRGGYHCEIAIGPSSNGVNAYIDAFEAGNLARFINHPCGAAARVPADERWKDPGLYRHDETSYFY